MKLAKYSFLIFLVLSLQAVAQTKISPLKEVRDKLVLPNYTAADRQTLADQAYLFMNELFVHRDVKVKDFGTSADPVPALKALKEEASGLSNEEFHKKISSTFKNLHDLHTNYLAPRPLACGITFIPLKFESVTDTKTRWFLFTRNSEAVVVSGKLKAQAQDTDGIEIGDQLISINGKPVDDVLSELKKVSGGANPDAMRVRAVEMLSMRSLRSHEVPQEDELKLVLLRGKEKIEKTVPWYAYRNLECEASVSNEENTQEDTNRDFNPSKLLNMGVDEFQKRYNKIFASPTLITKANKWAGESPLDEIFEMAALNTPAGMIGYIQLKEMSWDNPNLDVATVVEGFRRAIENRLSGAIGLVVDVRGNPGGYIVFAEKLVQLFSKKEVEPTRVQMLANKLNEDIFLAANGEDNRWSTAIRGAMKSGSNMIEPLAITSKTEANSLGQIWFRPVVVLTDAACFSACDLFAAGMQDNGAGIILGVHQTTGAGGANVMEHRVFQRIMQDADKNPFESLPFFQNMRVSWRQTVRAGKNAGALIEDAGVKSDLVVPIRRQDIGSASAELMKAIHKYIDDLQPKYTSGLAVRLGKNVLLQNGQEVKWTEQAYGVDRIDVMVGNQVVNSVDVKKSKTQQEVVISIPDFKREWSDQSVTLVGKRTSASGAIPFKGNRKGEQVFRVVRELMWRGDYFVMPPEELTLLPKNPDSLKPIHIVTLKGKSEDGWQFVGDTLRVGKDGHYENNVLSRAFLSLQLNQKGGRVTFDIKLRAESENDSLRIYFSNPDTAELVHVFAGANLSPKKDVALPLPEGWDRADVVFEFESDENWNMSGPEIEHIRFIQPQEEPIKEEPSTDKPGDGESSTSSKSSNR